MNTIFISDSSSQKESEKGEKIYYQYRKSEKSKIAFTQKAQRRQLNFVLNKTWGPQRQAHQKRPLIN